MADEDMTTEEYYNQDVNQDREEVNSSDVNQDREEVIQQPEKPKILKKKRTPRVMVEKLERVLDAPMKTEVPEGGDTHAFIDFFISKIADHVKDTEQLKHDAIEFLQIYSDSDEFAKFNPSVQAGAVILYFFEGEDELNEIFKIITSLVNKDELRECVYLVDPKHFSQTPLPTERGKERSRSKDDPPVTSCSRSIESATRGRETSSQDFRSSGDAPEVGTTNLNQKTLNAALGLLSSDRVHHVEQPAEEVVHPPVQQPAEERRRRRNVKNVPFSVDEVRKIIEAVDIVGIGRWAEVKNRAFGDAEHRSRQDIKDKWESLRHTADLQPNERRGDSANIPPEFLNKVKELHERGRININ